MVSQAAAADIDRPISAPVTPAPSGAARPISFPSLSSTLSTPDSIPTTHLNGSTSKAKGMQLGATKLPVGLRPHGDWAEEAAAEAEAEEAGGANPWGTDDLMDVNADQDDWSELNYWQECPRGAKLHDKVHSRVRRHRACRRCHRCLRVTILCQHIDTELIDFQVASSDWGDSLSSPPNKKAPQAQLQYPPQRSSTPSDSGHNDTIQIKGTSSSPASALTSMTKEEKAAEMARRKEERRQVRNFSDRCLRILLSLHSSVLRL